MSLQLKKPESRQEIILESESMLSIEKKKSEIEKRKIQKVSFPFVFLERGDIQNHEELCNFR